MRETNPNFESQNTSVRISHILSEKQSPKITMDKISNDFEQDNRDDDNNKDDEEEVFEESSEVPSIFLELNAMINEDSTPPHENEEIFHNCEKTTQDCKYFMSKVEKLERKLNNLSYFTIKFIHHSIVTLALVLQDEIKKHDTPTNPNSSQQKKDVFKFTWRNGRIYLSRGLCGFFLLFSLV